MSSTYSTQFLIVQNGDGTLVFSSSVGDKIKTAFEIFVLLIYCKPNMSWHLDTYVRMIHNACLDLLLASNSFFH